MQLIDGKATAKAIKIEIKAEVDSLLSEGHRAPHLAAILVGHDGGSETYVAFKIKDCEEVGFRSTLVRFEDDVDEEVLLQKIRDLNQDEELDGFISRKTDTKSFVLVPRDREVPAIVAPVGTWKRNGDLYVCSQD